LGLGPGLGAVEIGVGGVLTVTGVVAGVGVREGGIVVDFVEGASGEGKGIF
jgi:hypothetical protein